MFAENFVGMNAEWNGICYSEKFGEILNISNETFSTLSTHHSRIRLSSK